MEHSEVLNANPCRELVMDDPIQNRSNNAGDHDLRKFHGGSIEPPTGTPVERHPLKIRGTENHPRAKKQMPAAMTSKGEVAHPASRKGEL